MQILYCWSAKCTSSLSKLKVWRDPSIPIWYCKQPSGGLISESHVNWVTLISNDLVASTSANVKATVAESSSPTSIYTEIGRKKWSEKFYNPTLFKFQPQTFQPWIFLLGLRSGVKKFGAGMSFDQKIQFIKIGTSNQYCKNQVQIDKNNFVCYIGTYKIYKFNSSKSFVMIFLFDQK